MSDRAAVPTETGSGGLQQRLGLFDSTMIVAGIMIGSGIFIVSAEIARDTGGSGWLLAVWGLAGIMTILGALSYAELAAMMPKAGGMYVYLREAYSPMWGFLYGWTSFVVIQTGTIAAVAVAFAKFLGVFAPAWGTGPEAEIYRVDLGQQQMVKSIGADGKEVQTVQHEGVTLKLPLPWLAEPLTVFHRKAFTITRGQLVGVVMILFLTWWNTRGLTEGKLVQNVFTVIKLGSLTGLIVIGLLITVSPGIWNANLSNPWNGIFETQQFKTVNGLVPSGGLLVALMVMGGAMVGALFSADSWHNITFTAGEVRNPQRNLPLSLLLGTGIVITLYVLANLAYLSTLPLIGDPKAVDSLGRGIGNASNDRVGTAVLEQLWPQYGGKLMAVAIMISTFGCVNGLILAGARLTFAMARDNLFFSAVGSVNSHHVPAVALWLQAIWAILLTFSGTYNELLDYVIFAAVLFYALTVAGLFFLRWKQPNTPRPYRAIGYPVLPAIYVLLCSATMLDLLVVKPGFTWPGLILVLAGIPVYLLWKLGKG